VALQFVSEAQVFGKQLNAMGTGKAHMFIVIHLPIARDVHKREDDIKLKISYEHFKSE
jgi:hypothetical protein